MKGIIINDYNKVKSLLATSKGREKIRGAFQYFMSAIDNVAELRNAYQAFTTKGDFPAKTLEILERFHAIGDFDEGYKKIFNIRDFTGTTKSGFKIRSVESGLTFTKVITGQKVKIQKISGADISVTFDLYGGALGWDKTWIQDEEWWELEDTAIEFRNAEYKKRAQVHYDLIEALGTGNDVSWQSSPDGLSSGDRGYLASRDAETINQACYNILEDLKDKNYGVSANSKFFLLAPAAIKGRIQKALDYRIQGYNQSQKETIYAIDPIYTLMLSSSTDFYVGIPNKKLKGGLRQQLTLSSFEDILSNTEGMAGFARYGSAIGDTEQLRRCKTS